MNVTENVNASNHTQTHTNPKEIKNKIEINDIAKKPLRWIIKCQLISFQTKQIDWTNKLSE